jgi:acyl homoserine lactone synthase
MFFAADQASLQGLAGIRQSMFVDRAAQFVTRHKWPLRLDAAGFEVDEYDDARTTYCVVADAGRHLASLRLRPAAAGSMVEKHFPELWLSAEGRLVDCAEVTRFCAAPTLSADDRIAAVSDLLLGLCRHCQRSKIRSVFGVVFPSVARVIRQAGWLGELLSESRGEEVLRLVQWTPSELVAWTIQERREQQEEICARRREAAPLERLVA